MRLSSCISRFLFVTITTLQAKLSNTDETTATSSFDKNLQFYKFGLYGFLKNQRFFDPFLMLFFLEKGMTFFKLEYYMLFGKLEQTCWKYLLVFYQMH